MALAIPSLPSSSAVSSEASSLPVKPDLWRRYQTIVNDSRYSHFTRIPERIVRFLDTVQIEFDRNKVLERLLSHYLFIAVVDDAIDSGEDGVAQTVFACFRDVAGGLNDAARASEVAIVTEILRCQVEEDNRMGMLRALQRAHCEVIRERTTTSVGAYIKYRKALGRATAKQSYLLIRSALTEPNQELCRMMEEIGAVGCLVDSMIDIRDDHRSGLVNFQLTATGYVRLCVHTAIAGLRVWAKKPSLTLLLTEAVFDNIRDRGRPATIPQAQSSRQPIAQSFPGSVAHRL